MYVVVFVLFYFIYLCLTKKCIALCIFNLKKKNSFVLFGVLHVFFLVSIFFFIKKKSRFLSMGFYF
jgi:hypothetical protein